MIDNLIKGAVSSYSFSDFETEVDFLPPLLLTIRVVVVVQYCLKTAVAAEPPI